MSETEQRYAQIEKEGLAVTWACEKFASYILGKRISIETDHKPLVPLLGTKDLDNLPPRVLRFRLRLARFDYTISHVPGKALYTADTLSRAPLESSETDSSPQGEAELLLEMCLSNLPANKEWLDEYRASQSTDPVCSLVINYCRNGWPAKQDVDGIIKPYWEVQGELTVGNSLLLYGSRIVVLWSSSAANLEEDP